MHRLAIVVPYRDRQKHLDEFIPAITQKLNQEGIQFSIYVIEQEVGKPFNRAKLLNVGYAEASKDCDYFVFHDVDMLPLETDYQYNDAPIHLAARASQFQGRLPYNEYFGGVTLFPREWFERVNGFSNNYWGWGAEDDDMFKRCLALGYVLQRRPCSFQSLAHERVIDPTLYRANANLLHNFDTRAEDGLSNLEYTKLSEQTLSDNVFLIKVEI
jgi:beta-1,4-galactosyltransferase 1